MPIKTHLWRELKIAPRHASGSTRARPLGFSYEPMPSKSYELNLQSSLLLAAPGQIPGLRLFRRNVGVAKIESRFIHFAIAGQCDLYGVWVGGKLVELEVKSLAGRLSDNQQAWRDFCKRWHIPWLELRPWAGEAEEATVARWLRTISGTK